MKYTPLDPKEFKGSDFDCLPAGAYDFQVAKATESTSKTGNSMIKLELNIFSGDRQYKVWDYLVDTKKAHFKIHQFCEAVGLEYGKGDLLPIDCEGKAGEVFIKLTPAKDQYDEKNEVKYYISPNAPKSENPDPIDDLPF